MKQFYENDKNSTKPVRVKTGYQRTIYRAYIRSSIHHQNVPIRLLIHKAGMHYKWCKSNDLCCWVIRNGCLDAGIYWVMAK